MSNFNRKIFNVYLAQRVIIFIFVNGCVISMNNIVSVGSTHIAQSGSFFRQNNSGIGTGTGPGNESGGVTSLLFPMLSEQSQTLAFSTSEIEIEIATTTASASASVSVPVPVKTVPEKIEKPKRKLKYKIINTISYSHGLRTVCVYTCSRKPRNNKQFFSDGIPCSCPTPGAMVLSVGNSKWCCIFFRKKIVNVPNFLAESGKKGSEKFGPPSFLDSSQCYEPFDDDSHSGEDDLNLLGSQELIFFPQSVPETSANNLEVGKDAQHRRRTQNITIETSTEMASTEETSESSSPSTLTSELTTMTPTTTELTETTTPTTTTTTTTPPPQFISVHAYDNYKGTSERFPLFPDCSTLPNYWHSRISSVNTGGHCVKICPYAECRGNCMELQKGSKGHNRLRDINFDDRVQSVRQC